MKNFTRYFFYGATALIVGCNSGNPQRDTTYSGTINISVDESYKPLLDSEIKVFEAQHPLAHIIPHYESEADCFKDLINDSSRLIIVTRNLNEKEKKYFESIRMPVTGKILAWDALALIVNPASPDTNLTIQDVRDIMLGTYKENLQVVFDSQNSSTMRYIMDSIISGQPLTKNAVAAHGSENVVDYVAQNKHALGIIGVSWISDPNDSLTLSFLQKINVVGVKGKNGDRFFKPYQYYIALKSYPLTRAFYFVLREPYSGLGTGFANFLSEYKGQMIIAKYRLFPAKINIVFRDATIQ